VRRFDLNLLYTLRELLKEPNTTRVGEKLGLTQSAVSASLNRLRWAFQDELLVRSGRTMTPTKRAEKLFHPVDEILNLIEQLVEEVHLEPKNMERIFRVSSTELLLAYMVPPTIKKLQKEAPGVILKCEVASNEMRARMRSGHIDLTIAPLVPMEASINQISHTKLYTDRLVCIASKENQAVQNGVSVDEYLSMKHALCMPDPSKTDQLTAVENFINDTGLKLNVACEVTSYAILPGAVMGTDLIATIPERILALLPEKDELQIFDVPFESTEFEVSMIWNSVFDHDMEHRWFRELVERQFQKLQSHGE